MSELIWKGGALAIKQVATIVVSGTWATSDTATITINGKDLVLTAGAAVTTANIASALSAAINATSATNGVIGTETRNVGGQEIPELREVVATVNSSTVTVTANTAGKPFTISETVDTAGDGDLTLTLEATAATGPNHWDNADNWSGGAVPQSSDDVVIDQTGQYDILYGLAQSAVTLTSLTITNGFTKKIGLPKVNKDSAQYPYPEYRDTYLAVSATTLTIHGEGQGSGRIKIDLGANASTMGIQANGQSAETGVPSVLIQGTTTTNVARVTKGDVGFAFFDGESAHLATLEVGYVTNLAGDSTVRCGDGCDLGDATIKQTGGTLTTETANGTGTVTQTGGTFYAGGGAHASITASGTVFYNSVGTLTTLNVYSGATVDFRQATGAVTVTDTNMYRGSSLYDPSKRVTFTNAIDLEGCGLSDVTLDLGQHLTIQRTAI